MEFAIQSFKFKAGRRSPAAGATERMRTQTAIAVAVMATAFMAGCKSATDVQPSEIEGDYVVSGALLSGLDDPKNDNIDLLEFGFTVTFTSDGAGAFTITLTDPFGTTTVIDDTLEIDGTDLYDDGEKVGEVFVEGDQVALSLFAEDFEFDFDGNGETDPARLLLVMERE